MSDKRLALSRRHERIRKTVHGTAVRPRLAVFRSLQHLYAQIINDDEGKTLVGISTRAKTFSSAKDAGNVKGARLLGELLAKKARESKIEAVVFDRGGFVYHGRIKAFADGAREGGLKF